MSRFGLNYLLVDGGTTWNNNMDSGIKECFKIDGITDASQIEVDVIKLTPDVLETYPYNLSMSAQTNSLADVCI